MIHLLIADDHAIFREGLKQILGDTEDIVVSDEASNDIEVIEKITEKDFDLVLLDISMPGRGGMEVLKQLKKQKPQIPVLMLTMHPEDQYAVRALKAGASGYLTKDTVSEELIEAIRKIASGGKYISASLAEQLAHEFELQKGEAPHNTLSDREYEVLCMIASGRAVGDIAEEMALSVKTISTYRGRVLEKMGMKSNAELTRYVIEKKLIC